MVGYEHLAVAYELKKKDLEETIEKRKKEADKLVAEIKAKNKIIEEKEVKIEEMNGEIKELEDRLTQDIQKATDNLNSIKNHVEEKEQKKKEGPSIIIWKSNRRKRR